MRSKIKPPQQTTVLDRDVTVVRKLNFKKLPEGIIEILATTNLEPGIHEQQMSWWDEGYVANDHPRDSIISKFLIDNTLGFAVARTDTGEIIHDFGMDLAAADRAAASAKVKLDVDFELAVEDEDEELPVSED